MIKGIVNFYFIINFFNNFFKIIKLMLKLNVFNVVLKKFEYVNVLKGFLKYCYCFCLGFLGFFFFYCYK